MKKSLNKSWLVLEFVLLFFGIPFMLFLNRNKVIHPAIFILPVFIGILIYLHRCTDFRLKELIKINMTPGKFITYGFVILLSALAMLTGIYLFEPDNLFNLIRANFTAWIVICLFYPVFSAYGQEIIYRLFFFHRYKQIFKSDTIFILAGSAAFSFVHIFYFSAVSMILTFVLGLYLNQTFLKTKSVMLTAIIHGILGDLVFTLGLGSYFWLDMHRWM